MDARYFWRVGIFAGYGIIAAVLSTIGYSVSLNHNLNAQPAIMKFGLCGIIGYGILLALAIVVGIRTRNKQWGGLTTCLRWLVHSLVIVAVLVSGGILVYTFHCESHRLSCYGVHFLNFALFLHMVIGWAKNRRTIVMIGG
ncbi:MAG: hypothetical protein UT02_C0002G0054 [Parcubacteria group bacterium GW2011_GWC2_38_7]|nr:MAG: hypothetical protein UT02_C0002G0054 [Parcubacteria group bacterium GW2011_GWC2_38_7]